MTKEMMEWPLLVRLMEGRTNGTALRWSVTDIHREAAAEIERIQAEAEAEIERLKAKDVLEDKP